MIVLTTAELPIIIAAGKTITFNNTLTFSGTDGSTLNIGAGGTLGTAAFQNIGTSGANVPLLNGSNVHSGSNVFNGNTSIHPSASNAGQIFFGQTSNAFFGKNGSSGNVEILSATSLSGLRIAYGNGSSFPAPGSGIVISLLTDTTGQFYTTGTERFGYTATQWYVGTTASKLFVIGTTTGTVTSGTWTAGTIAINTTTLDPNTIGTVLNARATGTSNSGVEITGTSVDGDAVRTADVSFSAASNITGGGGTRIANIYTLTSGTTATNRGGRVVFATKVDGSGLANALNISNTQNLLLSTTVSDASARLHISDNKSFSQWTTGGCGLRFDAATYTDTTSSGTLGSKVAHGLALATFASISTTTVTAAATLYIAGSPVAGTNVTITNGHPLWIAAGTPRVDNPVAAPSTSAGTTIVNYYGSADTNFLGDPDEWLGINVSGTVYKIPLYS